MPSLINKQPVFTDQIILSVFSGNVGRCTDNYTPQTPTSIFTTTDSVGSLIERITVTATGDTSNYPTVLAKLVYMYIYEPNINSIWTLYKTGILAATTVTDTQPNPTIEWVFNGGLLLPQSAAIGFLASNTSTESGNPSDDLAIVIEGSSYTSI